MFGKNIKVRLWVLMPENEQNLQFNITRNQFMSCYKHILDKHPTWQQIRVYDKTEKSNTLLFTYFNYNNKKVYPTGHDF